MQRPNYKKLLDNLKTDKQADFDFQKRRHSQWTENYQLYRDTVITNRLTQRQSVNIPLMKTSLKTNLATLDEFPRIEFEELGNDKQKEIFLNAYWEDTVIKDRMELKDIVDKKQEQLYGITWRKLNIVQGKFCSEIKEPFDILKDRYADPTDYDNTAHHLIEGNIFRTLEQLEGNPYYDKAAISRLKVFYGTQNGLLRAEEVTKMMQAKNERLGQMGVGDIDNPALGHIVVELKAYFVKEYDLKDQESHLHLIVAADCGIAGKEILMAKPLKEILGIDFFPFTYWSSDPERNDHYPDGTADIIRTPNKVLNIFFSQLIENRTLRNFGMNFYDSTVKEGWTPQTLEPRPFGWYPLPGKPQDVFQAVQIPDLSESIDEMDYLKRLIESASAATATSKGETEQSKITLGEVELALQAAKERQSSVAKFYTLAQKEFGDKWAKIVNANTDKLEAVKLYKKSYKGNWFQKNLSPKDWRSEAGYSCRVVSSTEREQKNLETVQKMNAVKAQFPVNQALKRIYDKKVLEFGGLNPEEVQEVLDEEEQNMQLQQMQQQIQPQPQLTPQPNVPVPVA